MATAELKEIRRQMFAEMKEKLFENFKPEDSSFYYHSSEDRIVMHASCLRYILFQSVMVKTCQSLFH